MKHFANFYINLQEHAENSLRGLVDKYPNSEVGYASTNYLDALNNLRFKNAINLPNGEAISAELPLNKVNYGIKGYPFNLEGLKNLQMAHTHPKVLSANAAGVIGKDLDISNIPKYPSFGDLLTHKTIKESYEQFSNKGTVNPSLVFTEEYGEPVTYKYDSGLNQKNPYAKLNSFQDAVRLRLIEQDLYTKDSAGNSRFVKDISQPFLKRAALEEDISNSNDFFHQPFLKVERQAAHPIPVKLPDVGKSRLGETVATANAVGLAHGSYNLKKAYDERKKQKQQLKPDDVQLTNKYQ